MKQQSEPRVKPGQQPEALASLKSAARNDGVKPDSQGLQATRATAPRSETPGRADARAEDILHRNADADARKKK